MLQMYADLYNGGKIDDPGLDNLWGFYGTSNANRLATVRCRLVGLDEERLADDYPYQYIVQEVEDMDISDVDKKMFYENVATNIFKL